MSALADPVATGWPAGVTLLLGVGAQKAGTSWVHSVLSGHPACHAGPMKELHYFDGVFGRGGIGARLRRQRLDRLERAGRAEGPQARKIRRLQAAVEAPEPTHRAYVEVVTDGLRPGDVALDVSPVYGTLNDEAFAAMAGLGDTRFLFIMRDPVARMWSAIRMNVTNHTGLGDGFEERCRSRLDFVLDKREGGEFERSDYAATLRRLERHAPAPRRLVLFFESLFSQDTVNRIHDFLGIERRPLAGTAARNAGAGATMRPDQVARLIEEFRRQYEAVCAVLGAAAVPQQWHRRFGAVTP